MSDDFYDFNTLEEGSKQMVKLIQQLSKDKYPSRLISPPVKPGFLRSKLAQKPPQHGCSISQLLHDTKQHIFPGIMLWQSPRFFGYFPSTIAVTNVLAEMFVTSFHSPGFNYAMSPSHTQLQNIVVDWVTLALGLPQKYLFRSTGGGIINPSTTQSILVAVHAAKRKKMDELKVSENPQKIVKFVGYYGQFSFIANQRALKLKEIFYARAAPAIYCQKTQNLVIDTKKFQQMIEQDVGKGLIPFWYGGTYGTTFSCANDVNQQVIRICKKYGMWINVDAAYLGSSWICPELRPNMKLFQQIDSLCINFSKSLFMGNGGSLFFISDKIQLNHSMGSNLSFHFYKNQYTEQNNVINYKDWMFGLNRRNNSLKLYYLFCHYGLQRLQTFIHEIIKKADYLINKIEQSKIFKLFSKPQLGLVSFQLCDKTGKINNQLTKKLSEFIKNIQEGFSSPGQFQQYCTIRIVIGNPTSTIDIIDRYFQIIFEKGKKILEEEENCQQ